MLGVTPLEAEPSHCGAREEAVADICAVVGAVCQHDVDARHQIGAVVGSGRSASSASTSPLTSPGQSSLLATLASLPVRLMKEQR